MKRTTVVTAAALALGLGAFALPSALAGSTESEPAAAATGKLLSKNKTVTTSSHEGNSFKGAQAVDGDPATRWASVEGKDSQWISIDLGSVANVSRILLKWEAAYGKAYKIELSDDGKTWKSVYSTKAGDGGTDDQAVSGSGRYVRLTGTQRGTEWGYSLYEFEVYGTAGQDATEDGWALTWKDEFNQAQGTKPDPTKWVHDVGGEPQWGNEEWQYYTDRKENVSQDGKGNLAISARRERLPGMENCQYGPCDVTSGRITTLGKFEQEYGKFEARIKVPAGQGLWPAFWSMGNDIDSTGWPGNGEIDIMEIVGNEPSTLYGTIHGEGYSAEKGITGSVERPGGGVFADSFHVFSMEWSPDQIIWKLDGKQYFQVTKDSIPSGSRWAFDHPFYLLLNLAVGGVWPGSPDETTKFPATLLVDYVRVYTKA